MMPEAEHYTLDSTLDSVEKIEHLVLEYARRAGFCDISLEQISLAVHETAANAVFHGNKEILGKKVSLDIHATPDQLKIVITDEGNGFDPAKIPDPLAPEEMFRERGRGVYLTRALMDEYQVTCGAQGGSEVTLVKYLKPPRKCGEHT
ncbi:MAG TPA: ATP-binding protein [Bryobacteraceae bacterium]|jgi:serine/threonine-protein kinase RsbW|nr:ATP-binding protein [Bryobacteraceae bacterium]